MTIPSGRWGTLVRLGPFTGERYGTGVRWLAIGEHEYVRSVALVVRDRHWRTPGPAHLRVRDTGDGVVLTGNTLVGSSSLGWKLRFVASARELEVTATITAYGDVLVNRAGLVVLLDTATWGGAHFAATHRGELTRTQGRLPRSIAPHQPLVDLATLRLVTRDQNALDLAFQGDTFEMEDQRNWLDPSYKLYSRALSLPVPYRVADGEQIEQCVRIVPALPPTPRAKPRHRPRRGIVPALGIATTPARVPRQPRVIRAVAEMNAGFVQHRTDGSEDDLARAAAFARSLALPLHIGAIGKAAAHTAALAAVRPAQIAAHLVATDCIQALRSLAPDIVLAGGTFSDFVILNRNGVPAWAQRTTFALCPTVHSSDDRSLIESIDALPDVLKRASMLAVGRPLDVGPCTLQRQLRPHDGRAIRSSRDNRLCGIDPRQHMAIAGAWLASVVALCGAARIATLTAFEPSGDRGLITAHGAKVGFTPAAAVFSALAARSGEPVEVLSITAMSGAAFLVGRRSRSLWLVDLSGCPRVAPALVGAEYLRAGPAGACWRRVPPQPVVLSPYTVVVAPIPKGFTGRHHIVESWTQS